MSDFTNYLRQFHEGGSEPPREVVDACWQALARVLRAEMNRRGLWNLPPRYLGVEGSGHWLEGRDTPGASTPFEELVADCFSYVFVDRAQSLMAHLDTKMRIEGLVYRSVRNFIFERQRHHDPVGFRTYDLVRSGARRAVRAGRLACDAAPEAVDAATVLSLTGRVAQEAAPLDDAWLEPFARDLFELLFRPVRSRRSKAAEAFDELLTTLSANGISGFRLRDVVTPVKALVRAHWSAVAKAELGGEGTEIDSEGTPRPVAVETRDAAPVLALEDLARCVARLANRLGLDRRTLTYLHRVWSHFVAHAAELGTFRAPSARAVSRDTEVPRERVPELKRELGRLIRRCRSGQTAESER